MRKLFIISLLTFAACSPSLTGPPVPPVTSGDDLLSYFWPDSTASYSYNVSAGGDVHTISIHQGGSVVDQERDSGMVTSLSISRSNSRYSISGFSSYDFLGLAPWMQIVSDTTQPPPHPEYIRSIAALNSRYGNANGTLYAASDSILYQIDLATNGLMHPHALPISGLTLAEDESGTYLYAFKYGGRGIFWTSNGGISWSSDSTPAGTSITAFTSTYFSKVFCVACGSQLFEYSFGANKPFTNLQGTITALEVSPVDGDVIAADNLGNVFDASRQKPIGNAPLGAGVYGLAGNYISTDSGIYDFTKTSLPIVNAADSAIYSTGYSIFGGRRDGSIDHFSFLGPNINLHIPGALGMVTQFAYPNQGSHDPNKGIYTLASGKVFYQVDSLNWTAVNTMVNGDAPLASGALTLLQSDSGNWLAGYLETSFRGVQKGYGYRATSFGPYPQVKLDNNQTVFSDVLIVTYTTESNGVADTLNVPQYTIYYQRNKGPIRIEETYNGFTIVSRIQ